MTLVGTWIARTAGDASAVYTFAGELEALRFANAEGYYMEVLLVPHGEDARCYMPPAKSAPTAPATRSGD